MKKIIHNPNEMNRFAIKLAKTLKGGDILALVGDLGAGKTTFTQYLAKALEVKNRVVSPTFVLMRVYKVKSEKLKVRKQKDNIPATSYLPTGKAGPLPVTEFIHIDAYRLTGAADLEAIGALDYIGNPNTITVIEWADRVKNIFPKKTKWIKFEHGKKENERIITIK